MQWVEERYGKDFIDSQIKRNSGPEVKEGDYNNYHRISKVYWLTFITEEDMKQLPYTQKFKDWVQLLRAALNKQLPPGFEVANIEEQFLHYDQGGHFEVHRDTLCNPLVDCKIDRDGEHPRIITYLIYLNPNWTESDGGTFKIYEKWPEMIL